MEFRESKTIELKQMVIGDMKEGNCSRPVAAGKQEKKTKYILPH